MAAKKVEEALAKWHRSTRGIRNPLVDFDIEKCKQATKVLLEAMTSAGCQEAELGLNANEAEEFQLLKKSIQEEGRFPSSPQDQEAEWEEQQ
jgi:hypothetical protein